MFVWLIIWTALCIAERASGIDSLPNITVFIDNDAYFKWKYTSNASLVEWRAGDASGNILMNLEDGIVNTFVKYVNYIPGENSIGMSFSSVEYAYSGKYTVIVYPVTGSIEESSTYLSVLSDSIYRVYIHLVINNTRLEFENGTLEPGTLYINIDMDVLVRISLSRQSSSQIDWQNDTFSNQTSFLVHNTEVGDILTLYAEFPNIQGYITTVFTISVSDTKSLEPWLIAVIVVVVLAACVILIVIIVLLLKKKKSMKNGTTKTDDKPPPGTAGEVSSATLPPSSPKTLSGVTVEDDRIPQNTVSSPRRLPPLIPLPPVNRINPEINNDGSEHETKKKRKKKKHKKREHEDKNEAENGVDNQTFGNTD